MCVFLDRDGTIAKDVPYCPGPEQFELLPGAAAGIKQLNAVGFKVILVTNQSGIGRGYFTAAALGLVHEKMKVDLGVHGAHLDGIYYCPHRPDENCDCRKPKPKLILQAAAEHHIDLARSYFVGDTANDIAAGKAAGCTTVFITPNSQTIQPKSDYVAKNFLEASNLIVRAVGAGLKPDCSDSSRFK
jgi:D,D-heptose 1,7-bisphosphate phosphatase